jgi:hypothetical protein
VKYVSNKRKRNSRKPERRISVRAVRRDPPDLKKFSQALIALAMAEAEAQADAEQRDQHKRRDG